MSLDANARWYEIAGAAGLVAVLLAGASQYQPEGWKAAKASEIEATRAQRVAVGYICKATIAALMGREPEIIQITGIAGDVAYVGYTRPDDGTVWQQRCHLAGSRVIWAAAHGRWRTAPGDEIITFKFVPGSLLEISYHHGNPSDAITKFYSFSRLGNPHDVVEQ